MRSPVRNRVPVVLTAITIATLTGAAACTSSREPAPSESAPVAVATSPVAETEWPAHFEAGGVLQARTTAVIASRVLAPVTLVAVRPGDRVRRGQILIELDGASLTEGAVRADASAGAAAEGAAAAAGEVDRADAALVLATATHRRIAELNASRAATAQELDEAIAALAAARSSAAIARARQREAAAALDAANGNRRAARAEAAYAKLTAPFDGRVASRAVDPGSMAAPGAPLLVIESSDTLQLDVRLDAARAGAVTVGQSVSVRVDSDSPTAAAIEGRVDEIARIDTDTHSFAVKITLPNHADWRSGLFGRAR
ncbi:MAG: efflux RND transporter periplasmic adaptor subunit, partial [Acidobacteria bacterium]